LLTISKAERNRAFCAL